MFEMCKFELPKEKLDNRITIIEEWEKAYNNFISDCVRDGINVYKYLNRDNYSHIIVEYRPDYEQYLGVPLTSDVFEDSSLLDELDSTMFAYFQAKHKAQCRNDFEQLYGKLRKINESRFAAFFVKNSFGTYVNDDVEAAYMMYVQLKNETDGI